MQKQTLSRRLFLQQSGALAIGFRLFGPLARLVAQTAPATEGEPDAASLDSWLAVSKNGDVTVFTSKVDLGICIETALSQFVAEELDVPVGRVKMDVGDTTKTIEQGATV